MAEILYRGLSKEEKEEFKRLLAHSHLISRLREILSGFERETRGVTSDYDSPSWAYRQADRNGEARAYQKMLSILDHKESNV